MRGGRREASTYSTTVLSKGGCFWINSRQQEPVDKGETGETLPGSESRASLQRMSTGLERISQLAREHPDRKMQTIMHLVNTEALKGVHNRQDKNKAYGVDGVTKEEYNANIEANLKELMARMKQFGYRPQPVRRTYIPKDGSEKMRPLGVPAYEDKLGKVPWRTF